MVLSRLAREFADEIRHHDWSDAPFREDRAGHQREHDGRNAASQQLTEPETASVRTNVMWVVAQVLGHADPNFDPYEFAEWCGVNTNTPSGRPKSGHITAGLRSNERGGYDEPGGPETEDEEPFDQSNPAQHPTPAWLAPDARGFITKRGRMIHQTDQCPKYRYGIESARRHNRTIHPPLWTTVGSARAVGKAVCSYCWQA
jgi:hypothetical protein